MTKQSASVGAEAPSKDGGNVETPSPYGTRSRNRTGNSRPNYAEDKDQELDFDYPAPKKTNEAKKSTRLSNVSTATSSDTQRANGPPRKTTAPDEVKNSTPQTAPKESASTSQDPAAQMANGSAAASQPPKKRKVGAQSGNGESQHQGTSQSTTVVAASKRLAAQAQNANGYAPTNMLSFENIKSMPKDGKMIADDGTVLAPNGKSPQKKNYWIPDAIGLPYDERALQEYEP